MFWIGDPELPREDRPVVAWVGVSEDDVPWPDIAEALRGCRTVLDDAGLKDVECEIRLSSVSALSGKQLMEPGPTMVLGKCSMTTGLTWGFPSEIMSIVHEPVGSNGAKILMREVLLTLRI